jgi:hypothetical protein
MCASVHTCVPVRVDIHAPAQIECYSAKEATHKWCKKRDRAVVPVIIVIACVIAYSKANRHKVVAHSESFTVLVQGVECSMIGVSR